jgi:predicted nucleotidyltransferase
MNLKQQWAEALPLVQNSVPFDLASSTPVVFRVGSHSHGTYVPPEDETGVDDVDLMVVVIPPPEYVLGMQRFEHSEYKHGNLDVVIYDWSKWLRMVAKSNPNVVGTLWVEDEDRLALSPQGEQVNPFFFDPLGDLFWHRTRLLSKRMYPAFVGYARGQLHKMTHHAHQGYMGEKRKRLVEQYGYDVKNAAHLIRLLSMACEAFETGRLIVRRPDAQFLIAVKRGEYSREAVMEIASGLFERTERALAASDLPDEPHEVLIQNSMVAGYREWWEW